MQIRETAADISCPLLANLLSSRSDYFRDFHCNCSLHVWLSFQQQEGKKKKKKKEAVYTEWINITFSAPGGSGSSRSTLPECTSRSASFSIRAGGGWHSNMDTFQLLYSAIWLTDTQAHTHTHMHQYLHFKTDKREFHERKNSMYDPINKILLLCFN